LGRFSASAGAGGSSSSKTPGAPRKDLGKGGREKTNDESDVHLPQRNKKVVTLFYFYFYFYFY
jgi:hypothetical protein